MNIANHIIQNHNGTIEVESAVGKGTTFIITIPADETSSSPDGCGRGGVSAFQTACRDGVAEHRQTRQ
jgi:hypothetical protein